MLIETLATMAILLGGGQEAAPMAGGGQERAAPRGDYRDSCSGAYVNRGRLYADCRTRNNQVRGTSIELNRCSDYEIRNDNGLLVCGPNRGEYEDDNSGGGGGGGGGWNPNQPPRGDYQNSCGGVRVERGRLYADCRTRSPGLRRSSIELNRCRNDEIRNDNGLLVCGSWRGQYEEDNGGGPGWGRQTITVYWDANFRGASTRFDSEVANLGSSGFNDQISSLQVEGEWEVCSDAYFRGRCQTVRGDMRNLVLLGLNDSISSLRPVRR
jgi:hypothetical protein